METEIDSLLKQIDFYKVQQVYEEYCQIITDEPLETRFISIENRISTLVNSRPDLDDILHFIPDSWGSSFLIKCIEMCVEFQTPDNFKKITDSLIISDEITPSFSIYALIRDCRNYHKQEYFDFYLKYFDDKKLTPVYIWRLVGRIEDFQTEDNFKIVLNREDNNCIQSLYNICNPFREYVDKNYPENSYRYNSYDSYIL